MVRKRKIIMGVAAASAFCQPDRFVVLDKSFIILHAFRRQGPPDVIDQMKHEVTGWAR
jgi:hypothetical protein